MKSSRYHIFNEDAKTFLIDPDALLVQEIDADAVARLEEEQHRVMPISEFSLDNQAELVNGQHRVHCETNRICQQTHGIVGETSAPFVPEAIITIALFIAQKCNQSCAYCYGGDGEYGGSGMMSEETAYKSIDWLLEQSREAEQVYVGFFGGEPLLNFRLMKAAVSYSRNKESETGKKINFSVFTNATLLNDEIIEFLEVNQFSIHVSFDGPKAIQDAQRPFRGGIGSWDILVPKLKRLLKSFPETGCRATVFDFSDLLSVEKALHEIGFKNTDLVLAAPSLFTNQSDAINYERVLEGVEREAKLFYEKIKVRDESWFNGKKVKGLWGRSLRQGVELFLNGQRRMFRCAAGRRYVAISAQGEIYPCHRLVGIDEHHLGGISETDIERKIYHVPVYEQQSKCEKCIAKHLCLGGCYHENLGATGSAFDTNEERCNVERRIAEHAASISLRLDDEDIGFLFRGGIIQQTACPLDLF